MLPLITVLTVVRDSDLAGVRRAAVQVRYVALAAGGSEQVQWLIAVDDLSFPTEAVLTALRDVPVTGVHGREMGSLCQQVLSRVSVTSLEGTVSTKRRSSAASVAGANLGLPLALAGTLVTTFLGGLLFGFLRLRSGSLLAPIIAHIATNSLGFLALLAITY